MDGANLKVTFSSAGDLRTQPGTPNLVSFSPGATTTEGNFTRITATAVFDLTHTWYTFVGTEQVYPQYQMNTATQKYLGVTRCTQPTDKKTWLPQDNYYVRYSDYYLGSMSALAKGFDGFITLSASLTSLTPSTLDFGTDTYTITTKEFVGSVRRTYVTASEKSRIADYSTLYNADAKKVSVTTTDLTKDPPNYGGDVPGVGGLSVCGMSILDTKTAYPQQEKLDVPTQGQDVSSGFRLTLQPEVTYQYQQMQLTSRNNVLIDTYNHWYDTRYGLLESYSDPILTRNDIYRTIGWEIKNVMGKVSFRFECDLYAIVEMKPTFTNITLVDPNVELGDYWFRNDFGGDGGEIPLTESPVTTFFRNYSWLIALAVVAAVIIYVSPQITAFYAGRQSAK